MTLSPAQPTPIQIPSVAADLSQRAMLVRCPIRRWEAARTDDSLSREIAAKYGSDPKMGTYKRFLIASEHLEPIRKLADQIRAEHYARTLPWLDKGLRVLSSAGFLEYVRVLTDLCGQFDEAVRDFVAEYPQYQAEARVSLNGLYRASEYPTQAEVARLFEATYRIYPFPAAQDFRVAMSADEVDRVRDNIERGVREAMAVGMAEVWKRLQKVVGAMAERLSVYNPSGEKVTGAFRDSLVANVRDLVDLLPSLNVTGDPALAAFTERVERELLRHDAETLRDSVQARVETRSAADKILEQMKDFV